MSVVCNVLCEYGTWIACDGRALKDGVVVSEHVQKFRKINENVLVGFTGVLEIAEQVLDHISNRCGDAILGNVHSGAFADMLSVTLENSSINAVEPTTFLVTGKTGSGEVASFVIKQSGEIFRHTLTSKNQIITNSIGALNNEISLSDCLRHVIGAGALTREVIISSMKEYISSISDVSDSVNNNVLIAEILR